MKERIYVIICSCMLIIILATGCNGSCDTATEKFQYTIEHMTANTTEDHFIEETKDSLIQEGQEEDRRKIDASISSLRILKTNFKEADWQNPRIFVDYEDFALYIRYELSGDVWENQRTEEIKSRLIYDRQWFEDNSLILLPIKHLDWNYTHEVEMMFDQSGKLYINVVANQQAESVYPIESFWLLLIETARTEINDIDQAVVSMTEIICDEWKTVESKMEIKKMPLYLEPEYSLNSKGIFVIESREDLLAFRNSIILAEEEGADAQGEYWNEFVAAYDEEWFEDNMLLLLRKTDPYDGYEYELSVVWNSDEKIVQLQLLSCSKGMLYAQVTPLLLIIEVKKTTDMDDVSKVDVYMPYSGFNTKY